MVRSALNPLLWLCAVVCSPCWAVACLLRADAFALRFALGLSAVPVLTTCGVAVYFAIRKPERLQSEEFQLRQQMLQVLQGKGRRTTPSEALLMKLMNPSDDRPPATKEERA